LEQPHVDVARAYLRAIERGDVETVLACYHPDVVQIEWPNRLKPKGDRRAIGQLAADLERGKAILRSQSYEILNVGAAPNYVIFEVLWRGTLAIDRGALKAGDDMVAHSAIAFTFDNGKITSQRNYDCFDAF
jgi:ketosteroid isomerase-like protein